MGPLDPFQGMITSGALKDTARLFAALPRLLLSNGEAEALADCTACSSCLVSVLCVSSAPAILAETVEYHLN